MCDLLNTTVKLGAFPLSVLEVLVQISAQRMAILTQVSQEGTSDYTLAASLYNISNALFINYPVIQCHIV
jgi:hypothetical protein